jgi:hypothetical protein
MKIGRQIFDFRDVFTMSYNAVAEGMKGMFLINNMLNNLGVERLAPTKSEK